MAMAQPTTISAAFESNAPVRPPPELKQAEALNEGTLVGTRWQKDGVALEFGAEGRLLMGGRQRARWSVVGQRVRLYRDTTEEEHWLDIVGKSLFWQGQEIGREASPH